MSQKLAEYFVHYFNKNLAEQPDIFSEDDAQDVIIYTSDHESKFSIWSKLNPLEQFTAIHKPDLVACDEHGAKLVYFDTIIFKK